MVSKQDRVLVMVTVAFWAIMFMIMLAARPADARVALTEPAAFSIGADDCSMFVEGCSFAQGMSGVSNRDALAEDSYYKTIKDGAAMGIDAFGLDMQANTTQATWVLARLSAAMKRYNGENASAKKCIFVSYRNAGGEALAMFNAADSNNSSDSPYCAVDGKPLIGVKQTAACVNPLPGITGKGPFVVLGTMSAATDSVPTKTCVDAWKASNASRVISYPDAAMVAPATAKTTATNSGADYAVGVPATWARQCGGTECLGPTATNYTMRDGQGFLAAVTAMKTALTDRSNVVFPFAFPGNYADDQSWERARICDANDTVAKSGFTCSALPDRLRGTIPTGNAGKSNGNSAFMKAGLHRVGQWFAEKHKATADPAARPFIAWAHRQHPLALSSSGAAMTVRKTWTAAKDVFDYTYFTPSGSSFVAGLSPWGVWDMAPGDVFNGEASDAANGFLRMRTVTGPLQMGVGWPKGNPNVTWGDVYDIRPSVRPLGDGVWTNTISELKVSVSGTTTPSTTGGYARALQLNGFRTAYTGTEWNDFCNDVKGETYDIQVRYRTAGDFPKIVADTPIVERKTIGGHVFDVHETEEGWNCDIKQFYTLVNEAEGVQDIDAKAIYADTLARVNAFYGRNDAAIYTRGIQAFIEPRAGTIDATIEGMVVRFNGTTYGAATDFGICPSATVSVDTAKSLPGATGADAIYLTSYAATDTRVRVSVGSTVLGTYTLPARQLDQATPQTTIPLGTARGRPKFEVLDAAGNVIVAKDSEVSYTSTPQQRAGTTGRNLSTYADSLELPAGTQAAKASIIKVSADRAEGNSGTSESTFRIALDKPAAASSTVNWSVSSATADANDFYHLETTQPPTGPQCTNVAPPAPAAAIGATRLSFCDDFSVDSVARGTTADQRNITGAKKWSTEYPIFYAPAYQPAGDFRHDAAAGTMRIAPSVNKAQSAMQSVVVRNGQINGFYIGPASKFYVEYRFKLESGAGGQPALWSMDMCHWMSRPYPCSEQSALNEHLEVDVFEYNNGKATVHKWREANAGGVGVITPWADKSTHINCGGPAPGYTIGTFATFGWQANGSVATFFKNDVMTGSLGPTSCGIPWGLQSKGRYPLLIGGKVGDVIVMDFVRVWEAP